MAHVDENIGHDPHAAGPSPARPSRGGMSRIVGWWPFAAAFMAILAMDAAVYAFVKKRGVSVTGDEPHYLVVARAVSHFTVHPLPAYKTDLLTHRLFNWAAGTQPTNLSLQLYTGPHGGVSTHPIGLSVLMAPFVAVGGERLARLSVMAFAAAGFVYFFHRAAGLVGLTTRGRIVLGIVLAGPALWLGATQIYPDFLTGVFLACALVDVAIMETRRTLDGLGVAVSAFSLAVLPWMHQQNLVAAALALAGFLILGWRVSRTRVAVIAVVAVGSWLLLLGFNLYEYGHAEGLPQPFPSLNGAGVTEILGLLFDRHQGLFVQVPLAVVALVGMWLARRAAPVAVVATILGAASLIYLNGTFIHAPYGGTSFAGRFQWSSLVPILIWCPFTVAALDRVGRRVWGLGAVALVLWLVQSEPLIASHHAYYNQQITPGSPWDPAGYPGWWGPLDRVLPVLMPGGAQFGVPWFALLVAVGLVALGMAAVGLATRPSAGRAAVAVPVVVAVVAGIAVIAAVAPLPLPSKPLVFPGGDVGSPLAGGPSGLALSVPLQGTSKGSFSVRVSYRIEGGSGSAVQAVCEPAGGGVRPSPAAEALPGGDHVASIHVTCPTGAIGFGASVPPNTTLIVRSVQLTKTSSG